MYCDMFPPLSFLHPLPDHRCICCCPHLIWGGVGWAQNHSCPTSWAARGASLTERQQCLSVGSLPPYPLPGWQEYPEGLGGEEEPCPLLPLSLDEPGSMGSPAVVGRRVSTAPLTPLPWDRWGEVGWV